MRHGLKRQEHGLLQTQALRAAPQMSIGLIPSMSDSFPKAAIAEPLFYVQGHTRTWNDSWQRLYSGWSEVIVAFCLRQGLNQQSAQNVCQESMITLLRSHLGQTAG